MVLTLPLALPTTRNHTGEKLGFAIFDDENLDAAIGRNGMNINLASKITEYKIDGYGVKQYERIQEDQKTLLIDIEGLDNKISTILSSSDINTVSDLLDADMDELLKISGMDEELLDEAYEGVQSFIEREIETNDEDDEVPLEYEADEQSKLDSNEKNIDLLEEE